LVPREIAALLSGKRVILRETKRAVTPYGGAAVFIAFLGTIGLIKRVRRHMPTQWKSPNRIDPTDTFVAFLVTVLVGPGASLMRRCSAAIGRCMPCWG